MENSKVEKRLYVGGLSPVISQTDLKERFSKFGNVTDVEIITRKDEQGNPVKTFGYLSLNISETNLHKCMSILNKSKWKGGTLQIEYAKESFLHRLAKEKQELEEKGKKPVVDSKKNILDSMRSAGVVNFHMKAAVPGTEVPHHKVWNSQFGMLLPVLILYSLTKQNIIKYDPSKYCHNIRKLEATTGSDTLMNTPVSQLTWHLEGGDDEINKKRQGKFPAWKTLPKKKLRVANNCVMKDSSDPEVGTVVTGNKSLAKRQYQSKEWLDQRAKTKKINSSEMACVSGPVNKCSARQENRVSTFKAQGADFGSVRNSKDFFDSEVDSEEELKLVIENEERRRPEAIQNVVSEDSDNLEVVGKNFSLKYNTHWALKDEGSVRRLTEGSKTNITRNESDQEYDSADTDEIISINKTAKSFEPSRSELEEPQVNKVCWKSKGADSADIAKMTPVSKTTVKNAKEVEPTGESSSTPSAVKGSIPHNESDPSTDSEESTETEDSESKEDSEYEAMMQNCFRIDLSLADLEQLANNPAESPRGDNEGISSDDKKTNVVPKDAKPPVSEKSTPSTPAAKKNTTPEEILSSILEGESSEDEKKTKERTKEFNFPAFKGTKLLVSAKKPNEQTNEASGLQRKTRLDQYPSGSAVLKKQKTRVEQIEETSSSDSESDSLTGGPEPTPFKGVQSLWGPARQSLSCSEEKDKKKDQLKSETVLQKQKALRNEEQETLSKSGSSHAEDIKSASKPAAFGGIKSVSSCMEGTTNKDFKSEQVEESNSGLQVRRKHGGESSSSSGNNDGEQESSESKGVTKIKGNQNTEVNQELPRTTNASQVPDLNSNNSNLEKEKALRKKSQVGSPGNLEKQVLDNQKRLAALEQRQKETEVQKKLIQGALSNLDALSASKRTHIVFSSEEESDSEGLPSKETEHAGAIKKKIPFGDHEESEKSSAEEGSDLFGNEESKAQKENLQEKEKLGGKEFRKKTSGKLFDSSEDEEETDHDVDDQRFKIKPQFEGKVGQKLMELQSRFGTDERFRMDARFIESDQDDEGAEEIQKVTTTEDWELAAEKKKNLEILRSLLHINTETPQPSKEAAKSKKFKDVTALHYDPTREDHVVFETKVEEPKKESKAERKKKREEAEKLPEVSKEIYYDVAIDFKETFGPMKTAVDEKEIIAWDKNDDENEEVTPMEAETTQAVTHSFDFFSGTNSTQEESTGFAFSFFGTDTEEPKEKEASEPYEIETLKAAKALWQEDPRFQDSSSEGEDDDTEESELKNDGVTTGPESIPKKKANLFFFFKDDERLIEGPKLFCRSTNLEEERDEWEERRTALIEDYRKKHKDARRKIQAKR
nr:PREDICTED: nucleolar protein 8 [Latimeria chalumnae]|eukprot:XP_014344472.1 PREDICTED: nucleolar protein 8 [Latimeria chalumnae]